MRIGTNDRSDGRGPASRLLAGGLLACVVLVVTAPGTGLASSSEGAVAAPGPDAGVLDSATVGIQGNVFSPGMVAVGAGGTVTWTNNDGVAHTVNGGPVQSSVLDPGASFSYTFGSSGHFTYMCAIHPDMKGMVMVG